VVHINLYERLRPWKSVLIANLCALAAYLTIGRACLMLALPPGYATPLFPPAGIGLALAATVGWRVLPGIGLGALMLNLQLGWAGAHTPAQLNLYAALPIALGSMLQAGLGALLFRRWINPAIDSGRDVLRFLLLAPLTALIGASCAVGGLRLLDVLPRAELATNWVSWWAGDTIGILLAAPLSWIVCGQPRALWRRRRTLVGLPLLLSVGGFVTIYEQALRWEHAQHLQTFRLKAQQVGDLLQAQFSEHERFTYALARALSDNGRTLPVAEFSNIAHAYLDRRHELMAIEWLARVPDSQRAAFEAWARRHVDSGYTISEYGPNGARRPAPRRAEYFPILHIEPPGSRRQLGVDFRSEPRRAAALRQALETGAPVATAPLELMLKPGNGVVLMQAVGAATPDAAPFGVLCIVLELEAYLRQAVTQADFPGFAAALADTTAAGLPLPLHDAIRRPPGPDDTNRVLHFGGRSYLLRLAPTPAYLQQQRGWESWTVLTAGLLMTGLMGALMLLISGERAQIQAQVKDSTAKLREREARLQAILDNAADAILTVSHDGRVKTANAATGHLFGYPPEQLAGLRFDVLVPMATGDGSAGLLPQLARNPSGERELVGRTSAGQLFPLSVAVSRVVLPDEILFVCILRDLTEQQRSQEHIYRLAHHDPLTGLENRFSLNLRLEHLLVQARRKREAVAVLFIDLDRFKKINDSHGHHAGDLLLVAVAQRMKDLLREADAIARLGGDEFIIVMPGGITPELAGAVAVRLVQSLGAPYRLGGEIAHSGASVGIAMFPADGDDADTLLRHADIAMYAAKSAGRGNFQFFSPAMNAATHERLMLENRLWQALERNEFELYLQPQVALDSGQVIGAEALLRWHNAELGAVEPARFIPIAEECGLILPLGEWVLTVRRHHPAGPARPAAGAQPHRPGPARAGDHRNGRHARPGEHAPPAAPAARARHHGGDRRLRHRLFLAQLPEAVRDRPHQDRPRLRQGYRDRPERCDDRLGHHRPGPFARAGGGGGGGRNAGPVPLPARQAGRRSAGLPVRAADAGRPIPGLPQGPSATSTCPFNALISEVSSGGTPSGAGSTRSA